MRSLLKGRGRRRAARLPRPRLAPVSPHCLRCTHALAFHHWQTRVCHSHDYITYEHGQAVYEPCPCRRYTTPGGRL